MLQPMCGGLHFHLHVNPRDGAQVARIVWQAPLPMRLSTKSSPCKRYSAQHQKCQDQDVQESEEKVAAVEPLSGLPGSRWNCLTDSNHGTKVGGGLGEPGQGMLLRTLGGQQSGR